ncbi:MAG: hypothetical protein EAZ42_07090 [Verrucomicrobia bacterium]|nr:MAG: hypothetical protein EAZ42_07090 [Verrucomicrobiota bacterium]
MLSFAQPWGLLALLGIPIVLAIHMLQRKAVVLPISTLFLLGSQPKQSRHGRQIERLIASVPLWMQLLAVLLMTWLLCQPQWLHLTPVKRIALVIDSSASMAAFQPQLLEEIQKIQSDFKQTAERVEMIALESYPNRPRIYQGSSFLELLEKIKAWQPSDGSHAPNTAMQLARSRVSSQGSVIYLTDTPVENLPFECVQVGIGRPIENVGFTGIRIEENQGVPIIRATLRNYGKKAATRSWTILSEKSQSNAKEISIPAGGLMTLQVGFPSNQERAVLSLTADEFTLDDLIPAILPKEKQLTFSAQGNATELQSFASRLVRSIHASSLTAEAKKADISLFSLDPTSNPNITSNALIFTNGTVTNAKMRQGKITTSDHPWMEGLNWQTFQARESPSHASNMLDQVLLWQNGQPWIILREQGRARQLLFNFDIQSSNATSQSAFIVLLHRFAEQVRSQKIAPSATQLEIGQPLKITADDRLPLTAELVDLLGNTLPPLVQPITHAPRLPSFLTVNQNNQRLLHAAVAFADTREADFSACSSMALPGLTDRDAQASSDSDPWWRAMLLVLALALLIAWHAGTPSPSAARAR